MGNPIVVLETALASMKGLGLPEYPGVGPTNVFVVKQVDAEAIGFLQLARRRKIRGRYATRRPSNYRQAKVFQVKR